MLLSSISLALTRLGQRLGRWSPLALWPDGVASQGMWISPSTLPASFNDYTGTTPVAVPGTVADSANPVGLALDIRAGATALADPGNHMLQATSVARPLESARVNCLESTESLLTASWGAAGGASITSATTFEPSTQYGSISQGFTIAAGTYTISADIAAVSGNTALNFYIDGASGLFGNSEITVGSTPTRYSKTYEVTSDGFNIIRLQDRNASGYGSVYCTNFQCVRGATALPYQRVGAASDYTATGFPIYQKYDGVDDGMATASFAAGTLINGMDCMIPVRRYSAANCVAGLYNGIADATKFFGMAESASGSGCVGSGAGTPTVWVDNTQLTGGTAVTRGTLHTALTAGSYHILEFRNLDLSAWTATGFGLYTSYVFPGARGDIMLYPSTASTADKDAARQYLADKYGVTLP